MNSLKKIVVTLLVVVSYNLFVQDFNANLQIRPRYEFRNGVHVWDVKSFRMIPHIFNMANSVLDTNARKMSNYLGTEIDFTTSYAVHKYINISAVYS